VAPIISGGAQNSVITNSNIAQVSIFECQVATFENATCLNYFICVKSMNAIKTENKTLIEKISEPNAEHISLIHDKAMEILNTGNPVGFLMEQCAKIHAGDNDLIELLWMTVGCQLCSNTEGLQPDLSGESGKGKSDACKAVGHLIPKEYFIQGSHSTLSLFHSDNIPEGAVFFLDDVGNFSDKEEQLIKTITSQYQFTYTHTYTDMKKSGAKKAQTVSIPPRGTFWITNVDSSFDLQILNRFLKMQVDEGEVQDSAVYETQKEHAKTGSFRFAMTPEVEISLEMIEHLKGLNPCNVAIPYLDLIDWKDKKNRRNYPMFLDIIRASAALNQFQRHHLSERSIVADLSDYDRATRLWSGIERAQTTGLTSIEQLVLSAIIVSGSVGLTQMELSVKCSKEKGTISRAIHGIKQRNGSYNGGLMNKLKGGLSYNEDMHTYSCVSLTAGCENIVSLPNRLEAQALIDSCSQLQQVAEPCNSEITA
jgi:hypothetical protein